jgi:hypothetical protein
VWPKAHRAGAGDSRGRLGARRRLLRGLRRLPERETAGPRTLFIIGGLVSILFGVLLFARPGVGAVTLALLFGLFALIYGVSQITMGVELRRTGKTLNSVREDVTA